MKPTAPNETTDAAAPAQLIPEWSQLPRSGQRCKITGLSRSAINACILPTKANGFKPQVASRQIKSHKNASRGIRLVSTSSLLAFIAAQPSGFQIEEDNI